MLLLFDVFLLFMYTTITSDGYTGSKLQCIIILYYHPLLYNGIHYYRFLQLNSY